MNEWPNDALKKRTQVDDLASSDGPGKLKGRSLFIVQ
jgi:hypothetical protein